MNNNYKNLIINNLFFKISLFILINYFFSSLSIAEVSLNTVGDGSDCTSYKLIIQGKIQNSDVISVLEKLNFIQKKTSSFCDDGQLFLFLSSPGGDVYSAIEIGKIARKNEMVIIIHKESQCDSACVFILAGGVRRLVFGKIGIHRPYFPELDVDLSFEEIRKKREISISRIKKYLSEVDVSQDLIDAMLSIPPEKILYLTDRELGKYRLKEDATFDEKQTARSAYIHGLKSSEYRIRDSEASDYCLNKIYSNDPNEYTDCRLSIILRINLFEVASRREKARNCNYKVSQKKQLYECLRRAYSLGE